MRAAATIVHCHCSGSSLLPSQRERHVLSNWALNAVFVTAGSVRAESTSGGSSSPHAMSTHLTVPPSTE